MAKSNYNFIWKLKVVSRFLIYSDINLVIFFTLEFQTSPLDQISNKVLINNCLVHRRPNYEALDDKVTAMVMVLFNGGDGDGINDEPKKAYHSDVNKSIWENANTSEKREN